MCDRPATATRGRCAVRTGPRLASARNQPRNRRRNATVSPQPRGRRSPPRHPQGGHAIGVSRRPNPIYGTWQAICFLPFVTNNRRTQETTMDNSEFYRETKWCDACKTYVRFLMSVNHSFCIDCGSRVRMFNREESSRFAETVQRHKWQAS